MQLDATLRVMIEAAHAGGAEVRRFFRQELEITTKTVASDIVTQADIASESAILDRLRAAFPTAGIKSEEAGVIDSRSSNEWFIVDPLDGTHNFSLGFPMCGVLIARMQPWGTLTHGVVYEPIVHATFVAAHGAGAWHLETGAQLRTSTVTTLADSTVHYACGYRFAQNEPTTISRRLLQLRSQTARVTTSWSSACDLPAFVRGLSEAMVFDQTELHDLAAVIVVAREAGAQLLRFDGSPARDTDQDLLIAANPTMAAALQQTMVTALNQTARRERRAVASG